MEPAREPNPTSLSVKHGAGMVMAFACMAASGTGSLIYTDDTTQGGISRMKVHRNTLFYQLIKQIALNSKDFIVGDVVKTVIVDVLVTVNLLFTYIFVST